MLSTFKRSFTKTSIAACKLVPFCIYSLLDFSIAIIVAMTCEKLYAIYYPMKTNQGKLNKKRTGIILLSLLLFCLIVNVHFLFTHSIYRMQLGDYSNQTVTICSHTKWLKFYDYYWPYIDAIIFSFLPLILIIVFNVSIIRRLIEEAKKREELQQIKTYRNGSSLSKQMIRENLHRSFSTFSTKDINSIKIKIDENQPLSSKRLLSDISHIEPANHMRRRLAIVEFNIKYSFKNIAFAIKHEKPDNQSRVVASILLINISFLTLTAPIVILQIIDQIRYNNAFKLNIVYSDEKYFESIKSIFELFQYINHSINFFLYCLGGKTFRTATEKLFNEVYFAIFKRRLH